MNNDNNKETPDLLQSEYAAKQRKKIKRMKQIMAWAGIIVLAALYIAVFVIGLMGRAGTQDLLMACIIGTVLVPVTMYAMIRLTDTLAGKNIIDAGQDDAQQNKKNADQ